MFNGKRFPLACRIVHQHSFLPSELEFRGVEKFCLLTRFPFTSHSFFFYSSLCQFEKKFHWSTFSAINISVHFHPKGKLVLNFECTVNFHLLKQTFLLFCPLFFHTLFHSQFYFKFTISLTFFYLFFIQCFFLLQLFNHKNCKLIQS